MLKSNLKITLMSMTAAVIVGVGLIGQSGEAKAAATFQAIRIAKPSAAVVKPIAVVKPSIVVKPAAVVTPGYVTPGYGRRRICTVRRVVPGYVSPGYRTPGYTVPGYSRLVCYFTK
jgi:hypothetical protein